MFDELTCKIVSKLKVCAFQRVNSPLEDPVRRRLPSGIHCCSKGKVGNRKKNSIEMGSTGGSSNSRKGGHPLTSTSSTAHRILFVEV